MSDIFIFFNFFYIPLILLSFLVFKIKGTDLTYHVLIPLFSAYLLGGLFLYFTNDMSSYPRYFQLIALSVLVSLGLRKDHDITERVSLILVFWIIGQVLGSGSLILAVIFLEICFFLVFLGSEMNSSKRSPIKYILISLSLSLSTIVVISLVLKDSFWSESVFRIKKHIGQEIFLAHALPLLLLNSLLIKGFLLYFVSGSRRYQPTIHMLTTIGIFSVGISFYQEYVLNWNSINVMLTILFFSFFYWALFHLKGGKVTSRLDFKMFSINFIAVVLIPVFYQSKSAILMLITLFLIILFFERREYAINSRVMGILQSFLVLLCLPKVLTLGPYYYASILVFCFIIFECSYRQKASI